MPFDGKNFTETKPDVFSLDALIAWLEKQPADGEYNWASTSDCAGCRYLRAQGLGPDQYKDIPRYIRIAVFQKKFWTYGAVLDRAIALRRAEEARRG